MCEGIPPGHDGQMAGETKMQANNNINSKAAALAAAKQAALAKAAKLKAASKPANEAALADAINALHGKEVEQPAQPVLPPEVLAAATAVTTAANTRSASKPVEKKAVGGGLEAWREEQRKARMAREQRVQAIQHDIKDIKAKGAKMTDDDKAKLTALTADLAAAKGTVTGKAKAIKLVDDAIKLLESVAVEAQKHNIEMSPDTLSTFTVRPTKDALTAFRNEIEASGWTRKPVGFAAKPKVAKVEITIGTKVRIADKAKETYEDVIDPNGTYTVTKIVGNKAVIILDNGIDKLPTKALVQLNHLTA